MRDDKKSQSCGVYPGLWGLVLVGSLLSSAGACAQTAGATNLSNARAACLLKPPEPLKFPEHLAASGQGGSARFRLVFTRAEREPQIEMLNWYGHADLVEIAEAYVRGYRLPCLAAGERVEVEQELAFTTLPNDRAPEGETEVFKCLRTPDPGQVATPNLTRSRIKPKARGNVLLNLTFRTAEGAPEVDEVYVSAPFEFKVWVMDSVKAYRLPCLKPGSAPATMRRLFTFKANPSDPALQLRDMSLVPFLKAVKDVEKMPVKFDLDSMACPFKVIWALYQPLATNPVSEIGTRVPQRKPLLDWLGTLTLNLDEPQFEQLLGSTMVLTIPCGKVEL